MSNNVPTIYGGLIDAQRTAAGACFEDAESLAAFSYCHNFLNELAALRKVIETRPEVCCFDVAVQEFQYALSALITAQYRHAFGGLRLSFELSLATIYFSAHEVKLRQWLKGSRDITWNGIVDENKGVFAQDFVSAFYQPVAGLRKRFQGLAITVYRECSEYVHGNPSTHEHLSGDLQFKKEILMLWKEKLESIRTCSLYCAFYRYANILDFGLKAQIEPLMIDAFGHEESVREFFQESQP